MDNFITYLLQSSLCLTVFLLFYLLLLKKETFYIGNRAYLIITGCFSVFVPLFKILLPATGYTQEITYMMAPVFVNSRAQIHTTGTNWVQLLEIIYFTVTAILSLRFIFRLIQLSLLMKKNKSINMNGQKIVLLEQGSTPFSFLKTIFLTKEQISDTSVDNIIAHEKKHIHQLHSMDMIFFEIIKIIHWFNPFVWRFKKEIEAQHEFSADSGLLSDGMNINEYKNVLVAYSIGTGGGTITNNFNSLLKRRLEMLSIQKSHAFGKVKLFLTLPLMAALIMIIGFVNGCNSSISTAGQKDEKGSFVSTPVQTIEKSSSVSTTVHKDEKSSSVSTVLTKNKDVSSNSTLAPKDKDVSISTASKQKDDKEKVYTYIDQMPSFPGGDEGLYSFISNNLVYPDVAKRAGIMGKIYVQFVVDKDGSVTDVNVQKGIGAGCDEEAVRVVKMMPKWIPGKNKGELVKIRIAIPIVFALK